MQIRKIILSETNKWRKIIARYPGECVICQEEIMVGEHIENNSDQRINRHQKCAKELHELVNLKEKIIELFILGDNQEATSLYGKMAEIEADKIIKNYESQNKEITIERNHEKNKEFENKLKNDAELKNAANNLSYVEFVEIFRKKYLNYAKAILGDNFHALMVSKNKGIELRKEFDDKITHEFYSNWTKGKNKQKTISKNTLASNMRYFTNSIKECNEYIFWVDRYHDKESMKILISSFDQTKVKDIKIIASGFAGGTIDYELYSYIQSITKEFENDISLSFKIITNRDTHRDTHNRYILSSNVGFDVPSIDAIQKGQDSTINPLEPKILEHKKEVFLKNWENEQVLDIVKDWQKVSKFLEENGNAKSYRRECQKCKNVFTCKPQFRDNPTCLECFRNTKH